MHALKIIGLLVLAAVLAVVAIALMKITPRIGQMNPRQVVTNFEECAAAGNPVMESYPRQCRTPDGRVFVEEIAQQPEESTSTDAMQANGCAIAGCSGQLCVSADEASTIVTTCEYRSEYACYKEASCETQADGKCGWTQSDDLKKCLASSPSMEVQGDLQAI